MHTAGPDFSPELMRSFHGLVPVVLQREDVQNRIIYMPLTLLTLWFNDLSLPSHPRVTFIPPAPYAFLTHLLTTPHPQIDRPALLLSTSHMTLLPK